MDDGKNYIRLKTYNPFKVKYLYIDSANYDADAIFINNKVRVNFLEHYAHPDYDKLQVIICSIWRYQESIFRKCLDDLYNKLLILGYNSYDDMCEYLIDGLHKMKEEVEIK